jgi:outer membrane protein assembly factor BamB
MRITSRLAAVTLAAVTGLGLTTLPAAATGTNAPLWTARLHAARSTGYDVVVSPDGSTVFVTGQVRVTPHLDYPEIAAYDATTGAQLWQTEDTAVNGDFGQLAVSPDGSTVYAIGSGKPVGGKGYYAEIAAYDASTGTQLWTQAVGKNGEGAQVKVAPDGSAVYITGNDECGKPINICYLVAALDPSTGASLWEDQVANRGGAGPLAVSPDGSTLYVTGSVTPEGLLDSQYSTMAIDATTGATDWTTAYEVPGDAYADGIAVSPDGSTVFVTGDAQVSGSSYRTIAYDASTGSKLWEQALSVAKTGYPSGLAVSPDGSTVYVTGSVGLDERSYGTVAYDATTGARVWKTIYMGFGGQASALAVSPDGSTVYVTGDGANPPSTGHPEGVPQYTTLALAATTGAQQWVRHFGDVAKGSSTPYSITVSPDSSMVFVTGQSVSNLTTVAYGSGS